MKIQDQKFRNLFNIFLALIGATIVFRKPCTVLIIAFIVFNLVFIKNIKLTKQALWMAGIIALPFLLEVLFFWNNSTVSGGLKAAEKTVSMVVLPIFILGNYKIIDFYKIVFVFGRLIMLFMVICLIRVIIISPEHVQKYLNGIDLYESGYFFALSFKSHAPAANMHLAFASLINFYFALKDFQQKKPVGRLLISLLFVCLSVFFVLLLNTRLAVVFIFFAFIFILFHELLKVKNGRKMAQFAGLSVVLMAGVFYIYVQNNTYMKEKFTTKTFENLDKVGRLDEFEHPEVQVYNGIVTRLTIWKSAAELAVKNLPWGVGSADTKQAIRDHYKETNQKFLYKENFPAHNQLLDMTISFGIVGALAFLLHIFTLGWLGLKTRNSIIISFFVLFFISNMVDDFLIRFDGIVFCALWFSIFAACWLQQTQPVTHYKDPAVL